MVMTAEQFEALKKWVCAVAELEARKVHCEMTADNWVYEQWAAEDAEEKAKAAFTEDEDVA